MPLYDYVCKTCKKHFEIIVPLKDFDKKIKCKYCGKKLEKKISSVFFKVN